MAAFIKFLIEKTTSTGLFGTQAPTEPEPKEVLTVSLRLLQPQNLALLSFFY